MGKKKFTRGLSMKSEEIANYLSKKYDIEVITEGVSLYVDNKTLYIPIVFPEKEIPSLLQACHFLSCRAKYNTKAPRHLTPWEQKTWRYIEDLRICKTDLKDLYKSLDLSNVTGIDFFILNARKQNKTLTSFLPETREDVMTLNEMLWQHFNLKEKDLAEENNTYKQKIKDFSKEEKSTITKIKKDKEELDYHKRLIQDLKDSHAENIEKHTSNIKKLKSQIERADKLSKKSLKNELSNLRNSLSNIKESIKTDFSSKKIDRLRKVIKEYKERLKKLREDHELFLERVVPPESPSIEEMYRKEIYKYFRNIELDNSDRIQSLLEEVVIDPSEEKSLMPFSTMERHVPYSRRRDREIEYVAEEVKIPDPFHRAKISYLLKKYFFGKRVVSEVKGLKRGRLDRFAFHRKFTIFKDKEEVIRRQTAVSIAVNLSGVYRDHLLLAHSIASYCIQNYISCEVMGYYAGEEVFDTSFVPGNVLNKFNRVKSSLQTVILKSFDNPEIENIYSYEGEGKYSCDGESLRIIGKRLSDRREKRKILIVLSNSQPNISEGKKDVLLSDLKLTVKELSARKVETLAFGIASSYGKSIYPNYHNVKNGEELLEVGVSEFCKLMVNAKRKFVERID